MKKYRITILVFLAILTLYCSREPEMPPLFQLLRKDATGLDFENTLRQSSAFNVFNYMYFFNGGGVAVGDFNNDGLPDLYFSSNMGPNKMFLNEGNLKFRDITSEAGVAGLDGWTTGISVIDINNDGMLDLYVGQLGDYQNIRGQNQLFVCQEIRDGIPVYEDEAIYYGLDLVGFSTQAVFFDYDLDGDLDLFQMNHSLHQNGTFAARRRFDGQYHPLSGDRLLRNDTPAGGGKPVFTDVTKEAGIVSTVIGYGLGITTGDINNDGYPDIYIGNDFHENDYLYINQRDGTFRELSREYLRHTSQFSMGVDMADIDNDGWIDIFSLDMLPEDPVMLKSSLGEDNYNLYRYKLDNGYYYQFTRNNLQRNNGDGTFSEIGLFSGVAATDWSWSTLFADFDLDGNKDIFVSNGIPRRMNDIDYVHFQESRELQLVENTRHDVQEQELDIVEKMPRIKLPNKFFRNTGRLTFQDLERQIKNDLPTFSNGAACADLDNDGDLDLVVNNLEDEPFIYKNLLRESRPSEGAYLAVRLQGPERNRTAIGARVIVFRNNGQRQTEEYFPVRGYQSSALTPLHIGLGDPASIDSILLIWPDRSWQRIDPVPFDQTIAVRWQPGLPVYDFEQLKSRPHNPYKFTDLTNAAGLDFHHRENKFIEFNREPLIPNMVSAEGPALAVGDIDGDGLEDVFLGGAKHQPSALYRQLPGGRFALITSPAILQDSLFEDIDAVFADIDNDGDLDLVVASGGNEYRGKEEAMKQRAYRNDGRGRFERIDPFPDLYLTAACVLAADFNRDGLTDFFFGGRAVPWQYGLTPSSYLMQNMGNGRFQDVTDQLAPELRNAGLVKGGAWADIDGNGDPDLILAMEWEPVTLFLNKGNRFEKKPIDQRKGWWNFVLPVDVDGDGDLDILAGNTGKNCRFQPSESTPVRLYARDFDNNGQTDQLVTYFVKGKEIPFANYEELTRALPELKKKFLFAKDFARATPAELLGSDQLKKAVYREATCFESMLFENTGKGLAFAGHTLPDALQISTLQAGANADLTGNGRQDIVLGGNFFACNIEMGRYDAFYGGVLSFRENLRPATHPLGTIAMTGEVRRIRQIQVNGKRCFIFARNNDSVILLEAVHPSLTVQ